MTSQVTGWKGRSLALFFLLEGMGRGRLYELFSITNPAFAAEMAQLLSRPEYKDPTTETSLGHPRDCQVSLERDGRRPNHM